MNESGMGRLLAPRSVAVVGASERNFYSRNVLANLRKHGFAGRIAPVNPRAAEVDGLPCVPSLRETDGIDAVVVATPAGAVPGVVADAAAARAGGIVILSTGFTEVGEEGAARERELLETAERHGMPIVGPNTIGMYAVPSGFAAIGAPVPWEVEPGPVALVMQSGGLITGAVAALAHAGVGLSYAVSLGNARGTDAADWIAAIAARPEVTTIGLLLETLPPWERFGPAVELAAAHDVRIHVVKVGRSAPGQAAAATHTGALAGDHRVARDLLRQAGVREARTLDGLLLALHLEASAGRPKGGNVGVIAASGGAVGSFADLADERGVTLRPFGAATRDTLTARGITSTHNPLDIGGQALSDPGLMSATVDAVLSDPDVAVGVYLPSLGLPGPELTAHRDQLRIVTEAARSTTTPVIAGQLTFSPGTNEAIALHAGSPNVVIAPSADAVLDALATWLPDTAEAATRPEYPPPAPASTDPGALSEWAVKQRLRDAGLPVPYGLLHDPSEPAPDVAFYPVVVKGMSPGVLHKSAAGLVRLDVADAAGLAAAERAIKAAADDAGLNLEQVLIEEMAGPGLDLFVSLSRQPAGDVLAVGLGGTDVEHADRVRFLGVPFTPADVDRILTELGIRITHAATARLRELLDSLTAFRTAERLSTLELNPVRVLGEDLLLLDAVALPY